MIEYLILFGFLIVGLLIVVSYTKSTIREGTCGFCEKGKRLPKALKRYEKSGKREKGSEIAPWEDN